MSAVPLIPAQDRDLIRRLLAIALFLFLFTAGFAKLYRVYSHKFFDRTGEGKWIWAQHRLNANQPLAFFAAREFTLPPNRAYAKLKLGGDPEYTVWINGREVAGALTGPVADLHLYDLTELVRTGPNRLVVAVRAPQGNGGLLASLDISPELENWIVTDERWTIYRTWRPDLLVAHPTDLWSERPMVIGAPPIGRWNYLDIVPRQPPPPLTTDIAPRDVFELEGQLPAIRTRQGIALAVAEKAPATAHDFGFNRGRIRLTLDRPPNQSRAVKVRFANLREELTTVEWNLRTFVFAPGEQELTSPEVHNFRYVMVFGRGVGVRVVR